MQTESAISKIISHSLRVRVEGRVQGVGFRYFVQEKAVLLGLSGWVQNRPDGSVEAEAEGPRALLEQWLEALRQGGPPLSRVATLTTDWSSCPNPLKTFQIR